MMANMPVPLVIATIAPFTPPIRTRSIITGDPGYADATAFVALARGALAQCSASGTARTQAQHDLTDAEAALAKNNPQAVRRLAKSAIDTCATPNR
jgi:hypothetical protein